jgi:hypothetical protein
MFPNASRENETTNRIVIKPISCEMIPIDRVLLYILQSTTTPFVFSHSYAIVFRTENGVGVNSVNDVL